MHTKVSFTDEELRLIADKSYIEKKRLAFGKILQLLNELNDAIEILKSDYKTILPEAAINSSGKISRGENLIGLPYMVLDNVRVFSQKDVFAFRTLFWWGNFFSSTIHISGKYFEMLKPVLPSLLHQLKPENKFIGINTHQWHHHFEKDNYLLFSDLIRSESMTNAVLKNGFVKIASKSAINQPDLAIANAFEFYKEFMEVLQKNITSR